MSEKNIKENNERGGALRVTYEVITISRKKLNQESQWARKFKKVQAKKIVKSNKSFFPVKLHFWQF